MKLFGKKRFYQAIFLSLSISAIPIAIPIVFSLENNHNHGGTPMFILFLFSLFIFYLIISASFYSVIGSISSSRYKNRYLSEKDISRLDAEGKAIVQDFLKKRGEPITEKKYDSMRKYILSEKKEGAKRMKVEADKKKALSFQKKAFLQQTADGK
jgi:hypothetical protein